MNKCKWFFDDETKGFATDCGHVHTTVSNGLGTCPYCNLPVDVRQCDPPFSRCSCGRFPAICDRDGDNGKPEFWVECGNCGRSADWAETEDDALANWEDEIDGQYPTIPPVVC